MFTIGLSTGKTSDFGSEVGFVSRAEPSGYPDASVSDDLKRSEIMSVLQMTQITSAFAAAVKLHREKQNLSKAALAKQADLHQTYIGLLEAGNRSPNLETAAAIARALGLSLSSLIAEVEQEVSNTVKRQAGEAAQCKPGLA
jgi:ribosome-binding protein aMBF1 (putative translation factor)